MRSLSKALLTVLVAAMLSGPAHGQLYVVDAALGNIGEYNASTGELINSFFIENLRRPHGLTLADGYLYVTEYDSDFGYVSKYNAATGAKVNDTLVRGIMSPQAVAISGRALFVSSLDGHGTGLVGKYDAETGAGINPSLITGLSTPLGLVATESHLYVVSNEGATSVGDYDPNTGAPINRRLVPGGMEPDGLVRAGADLFVVFGGNAPYGMIYKFDAATGEGVFGRFRPFVQGLNYPTTVALSGNVLYVASPADGTISTYNAITGEAIRVPLITGLHSVSGIAVTPSGDFVDNQPSLHDQFVLARKTNHLDNLAYVMWAYGDYIVAFLAVVALGFIYLLWRIARWLAPRPAAPQTDAVDEPEPPPSTP